MIQRLKTENLLLAVLLAGGTLVNAKQVGHGLPSFAPGERVIADAHNCYPYDGQWKDRIDRALSGGLPVAIEQDLIWYVPKNAGAPRSLVAHVPPLSGNEPDLEQYFFARVRPIVESALANPDHSKWPIITLNLDFKTEEPEQLRGILHLLQSHQTWLTTAPKTTTSQPQPLKVGPILVLNGPSDAQQKIFYDEIPAGDRIVTFGAVHTNMKDSSAPAPVIETESVTNYRRWWNNPWEVIEPEGQAKAGPWTAEKNARLQSFVAHAHANGLWIRFYTLDGVTREELKANGWSSHYNFASAAAAEARWEACIRDGVDYIATDQYERLASVVRSIRGR